MEAAIGVTFEALVAAELINARQLHKRHNSLHESYAVIAEELDEFWDEVKCKDPDRLQCLKELVQTAAMCQRAAEDLGLIQGA